MPPAHPAPIFVTVILGLFALAAAAACGGGDDAPEVTPTDAFTPTPFSLGNSLTVRGQEMPIPEGVSYFNDKEECRQEASAQTDECRNGLKMLTRGDSYILFDPATPRVISRRIEPEDEADFRPLLQLITGTATGDSPGASPTS